MPVDYPFPGLWQILSEDADVSLEYNSESYDSTPETLKGMLRPQNVQVNHEMLQVGIDKRGTREERLERAYSEYARAYKILETQVLWSADVSSGELSDILFRDLGLFDPAAVSLEDLCSRGITDFMVEEQRDVGAFEKKMRKYGPSHQMQKVFDVQRGLARLHGEL